MAQRTQGVDHGSPARAERLGHPGPDQGYVLSLAERMRPRVKVTSGESVDDAIQGCIGIALRRASVYGRAPVIHDLDIAFTMWGFFLDAPPADLVAARKQLFEGVSNVVHHYVEARQLVDMVPDSTMRMTPEMVRKSMPNSWRALTGA
ncbi:MAG: hypothetical protein EBQ57_08575 [Actinobacteria bacterium]|nr:hypothetical protein [Actinomycetota bacterium]